VRRDSLSERKTRQNLEVWQAAVAFLNETSLLQLLLLTYRINFDTVFNS